MRIPHSHPLPNPVLTGSIIVGGALAIGGLVGGLGGAVLVYKRVTKKKEFELPTVHYMTKEQVSVGTVV